jgi:Cu/Ag efflux pump CusA
MVGVPFALIGVVGGLYATALPLALGLGEGSEMLRPLAVCMVFGLAYSMLVTLLLISSLYVLAHRGRRRAALSAQQAP